MSCCYMNWVGVTCRCSGGGIAVLPLATPGADSFTVPRDKMHEAFIRGVSEIDAALNKHEHATPTLATRREWIKPLTSEEIVCLPVKRKAFAPFTQDEVRRVVGEVGGTIRIKVKVDPTMQPGEMHIEQFVDPLDVTYDGVTLRDLLEVDAARRREHDIGCIPWRNVDPWTWTQAQRAAISAHWSAQLRAKVTATKRADAERARNQVTIDTEDY